MDKEKIAKERKVIPDPIDEKEERERKMKLRKEIVFQKLLLREGFKRL